MPARLGSSRSCKCVACWKTRRARLSGTTGDKTTSLVKIVRHLVYVLRISQYDCYKAIEKNASSLAYAYCRSEVMRATVFARNNAMGI